MNSTGIDWAQYSRDYDRMVEINPYYELNMRLVMELCREMLPEIPESVCDLGAGTGNYILRLSELFPEASFVHVDSNAAMNDLARQKYEAQGLEVQIVESDMERWEPTNGTYDLVFCINALYAFGEPTAPLKKIRNSLTSRGRFVVVDYGRTMDVLGWTAELLRHLYRTRGVGGIVTALRSAPGIMRQNSVGSKMQRSGEYWTHSNEEFLCALREAEFEVLRSGTCYRGACDYALCVRA